MSGTTSKELRAMHDELHRAVKQARHLRTMDEPLAQRVAALEARHTSFVRRLRLWILGR